MTPSLNLVLTHDGERWVGRAPCIEVAASTLAELDARVTEQVRTHHGYAPGSTIEVLMSYDFDAFPVWLRQYHNHYFNRRVTLRL